jgi:glycosyltransferase involved in cell wall biosynthesis
MRIAFLGPYPAEAHLPPGGLGADHRDRHEHPATWMSHLISGLSRHSSVELAVFAESRSIRRIHTVKSQGATITFLPKHEPIRSDPHHAFWPSRLRLRGPLKAFRPDVVQGFGTESGYGYIATRMPYPSVVFIQGILARIGPCLDTMPLHMRAMLRYERAAILRAGAIVAETAFASQWAQSIRPDALIHTIPHGADPAWFDLERESTAGLVAAVGTLRQIKGFDTVIRAFALVTNPAARLVVIGDGPGLDADQALAASLGIADRVTFTGSLPLPRVIETLRRAQVLLLGSRMDTAPNVITEAHALGVPVIATAVGGIPDMIEDGVDGFLVPVNCPEAMAFHLRQILASPESARQMGEAGRNKVRRLNHPDRVTDLHLALYDALLKRRTSEVAS